MSSAGTKGFIMESTKSTWTFTCRCHKEIKFDIEREAKAPRDRDLEVDQIERQVRARGWVSKRMLDNDGRPHVFAYCSVSCHNDQVRVDKRFSLHVAWWSRRGFHGEAPTCCCGLVADERGFLARTRDPDCAWHAWYDQYEARCAQRERELFEEWKDVPVGTIVVHREDGRAGIIKEPARLVSYSFGGWPHVLVPVDGWGPHPHAKDLVLPEGDGWYWLPPVQGAESQ